MNPTAGISIQSTAGAVPVRNDKGEVSMQKVKVHRYVSGKRPDYAPMSSSEEESDDDDFTDQKRRLPVASTAVVEPAEQEAPGNIEVDDPRLRRLKTRKVEEPPEEAEEEDRVERHRHIHAPAIVEDEASDEERQKRRKIESSEEEEEEDELSDDEIERRRLMLKQKLLNHKDESDVEVLDKEDENHSPEESESESSEYEEYSDSEEETGPRLKPVFVRKKDRVTVLEKEREALKVKQAEIDAKKMAEDRRKHTLKMVEEEVRKETAPLKDGDEPNLNDVNTDDENDEVEYEAWKVRELKRIKRDREEREQMEKERLEVERLRNMTEEERRQELRNNPKIVTNKAAKGKYKFLQKYYHRGAFFMDEDDDLYKRDFSAATLEDHFDKTILPKVMQVKNFGRSGRTKYTHLVDQDTTQFDSPWVSETAQNLKFHNTLAAGMKQTFERPSVLKRKQQQ
ncbi:Microfibrillar-associated protein 1 [Gryllus bimaculatus]|nr:Microfibrillar-associated protein 1 [Gryllus bimaculatus]